MKRRGSARVAEPPSPIPQMDGRHKQTPNKPNQQTPTKPTPKQQEPASQEWYPPRSPPRLVYDWNA